MKVKAVGKTHLLLILTAAEARLLGIPTRCGCAMLLRTHVPLFRYAISQNRRFRCRVTPQVFHLESASALLECVSSLCRVPHMIKNAALYAMDGGYDLILTPTCRCFFSLRSLAGEYGALTGRSDTAAAFTREHGRPLSENVLADMGPYF